MPIKPENRHRYPPDWPQVRDRILQRAGYRCEHPGCCARQYSVGWWVLEGVAQAGPWRWVAAWGQNDNPRTYAEAREVAAELYHSRSEEGLKPIVIVLTVAHLNHQPEDCDDENLRAMCQRHHLAHDQEHHRASAQATRRARSGTPDLFPEVAP